MENKYSKGFTLLELLVSLSIITLILISFFKVYNSTIRVNTKNDIDIKALNLAQSEIENLRNQIKSKEDNEDIEIKYTIDSNIDNPDDSDINSIGIKIPIKDSNDEMEWIQDGKNFILNIHNDKYTNVTDINISESEIIKSRSQLIYKKKLSNKYYIVKLNITRQNIITINSDTGMYIYNINIDVQPDSNYFSKKKTSINNVSILTGRFDSETEDNDTNTKPPIIELPEGTMLNQHHEINISSNGTPFYSNLESEIYTNYLVYRENSGNLKLDKNIIDKKFKVEDVSIKLEYKPNYENPYNVMNVTVEYKDGKVVKAYHLGNEWNGAVYKPFDKIQIATKGKMNYYNSGGFDSGVTIKNLRINGYLIGNFTGNKSYEIENTEDGITIEFDGFIKNDIVDNRPDHTKVFFAFE